MVVARPTHPIPFAMNYGSPSQRVSPNVTTHALVYPHTLFFFLVLSTLKKIKSPQKVNANETLSGGKSI